MDKPNFYEQVVEMDEDTLAQIVGQMVRVGRFYQMESLDDGRVIATKVRDIVDEYLETQQLPEEFEDERDFAVALGCLYGHAVCVGYDWDWKIFIFEDGDATQGLASPKEYFSINPLEYIYTVLTGQNIGADGSNDNTILLLYNMLENVDEHPADMMYMLLS